MKNTSIKYHTESLQAGVDLLGHELSTFLFLLNTSSKRIRAEAMKVPTEAEKATRERSLFGGKRDKRRPNWLVGYGRYHPAFATEASITEQCDVLRKLVSAWVATGQHRDGIHDPKERGLYGNAEFDEYLKWRKQAKLVADEGGAGWDVPLRLRLPGGEETPRSEAYVLMLQLLTSADRFHIAKCSRPECGKFYWRKSLSPAKSGLFHNEQCQRRGSSKKTKEKQRDALLQRRIEWAAEVVQMNLPREATARDIRRVKEEIVKAVNDKKWRDEDGIKLSWVSRHWSTIVERVHKPERRGK